MQRITTVAVVVAALSLGACGGSRSSSPGPHLDRVRLGMTSQEARRVAGTPLDDVAAPCGPASPRYLVYAGQHGKKLTSYVLLIDDRVVKVVADDRPLVSAPDDQLATCTGLVPAAS
ncbi:MAG TPA: hypothetical protein VM734_05740 [Kofleriaceae bacterium]|nr:hypothetical protein [Kofleriaceae bacterium]